MVEVADVVEDVRDSVVEDDLVKEDVVKEDVVRKDGDLCNGDDKQDVWVDVELGVQNIVDVVCKGVVVE